MRTRPCVLVVALCTMPLRTIVPQSFAGRAVEDSTGRDLVRFQVILWKLTRDSAYAVDSARTDDSGEFELAGDGAGVYQLRFGTRAMPVAIGPIDSIAMDSANARLYRVPLMRLGAATPFVFEQVDVTAVTTVYNPDGHYPGDLRKRCIDGDVLPSVVVDGDGKPDMETFRIVGASNPAFVDAVRDAVAEARFQPAEIGGFHVRQLVSSPVHFRSNCRR
jgi:hypothetical protein